MSEGRGSAGGVFQPSHRKTFFVNQGDLIIDSHNGACDFGFADGHAEIHKWMQTDTVHAITGERSWLPYAAASPYTDLLWVLSRCSPRFVSSKPGQVPGR